MGDKIFTYKFIRYGGLSKMNQKGRVNTDNFHSAPRKKGIYAFPANYTLDKFLLGATNHPSNPSNKSFWLKDENGNKIDNNKIYDFNQPYDKKTMDYPLKPEYQKLLKKYKIKQKDLSSIYVEKDDKHYTVVYKKPRVFEYSGDLWCHLEHFRPEHIIDACGSWYNVSIRDYILALKKEEHSLRKEIHSSGIMGDNIVGINPFRIYSLDHLEVFIEKIN